LLEWGSYLAECLFAAALQHDVSAADHGADCEDGSCWGGFDELEVLNILLNIFRFIVRCLFALLVSYWAIFVIYTIKKLFSGGPNAVVSWYEHIDTRIIRTEPTAGAFVVWIQPWDWRLFLVRQVVILILTIGVSVLVLRWKHTQSKNVT
jgi:hypothetical protein